jgi:hypothetical protein
MSITRAGIAAKLPVMAELILQTKVPDSFLFFDENPKDWENNLGASGSTVRGCHC